MYKTLPNYKEEVTGGSISLCTAILIQAVLDYQELNKRGVESRNEGKRGKYSKDELACFFKSEWCDFLLTSINSNFTGEYILSCLKAQQQIN